MKRQPSGRCKSIMIPLHTLTRMAITKNTTITSVDGRNWNPPPNAITNVKK